MEREFSVDAKIKEQANGNRGTYKLTDNFFRFWYAFGFANFSQLEDGDVDGVYEYIVSPNSINLHQSHLKMYAVSLFGKCKKITNCRSDIPKWDGGQERQQ